MVLSLFDKEEAHVHEENKELDPGPEINRRLCALGAKRGPHRARAMAARMIGA